MFVNNYFISSVHTKTDRHHVNSIQRVLLMLLFMLSVCIYFLLLVLAVRIYALVQLLC